MKLKNIQVKKIFFSVVAIAFLSLLFPKQSFAAQICAYVAPDNRYACIPGNGQNGISSCSSLRGCNNKTCILIDLNKCGALAQNNTPANPNTPNSPDTAPAKVDCEKNKDLPDCIYNPLPTDDLTSTFLLIIKGFLAIVGIWAVIFIIVGGFRMVVSAGNEEAVLQGKKTVTWAVIGLMVALLSFSAISIVQNLLHTAVK